MRVDPYRSCQKPLLKYLTITRSWRFRLTLPREVYLDTEEHRSVKGLLVWSNVMF